MTAKPFQPWTWKPPQKDTSEKSKIVRQDGFAKASGNAAYTRDIYLPGMLYAKILTSPYAHAKIRNVDITEAKTLPGVRDILVYSDPDIAEDNAIGQEPSARMYNVLTLPGTADFYEHPMGVAVVAVSEEICDRALKLIKIQWEELDFILDMHESLKPGATRIMPQVKRLDPKAKDPNVVTTEEREVGDVARGFTEADRIFEYTIEKEWNAVAGVEALSCLAQWRNDFLDLWVHHQVDPQGNISAYDNWTSGFTLGNAKAPFTKWSKIKLVFPFQGSLFGGLTWLAYSTCFVRLAVVLAKRAGGRPVKLVYDESNFYCNGDDSGTYACKIGVKNDGTITAAQWDITGLRNPIFDKTYECTAIPSVRGTHRWPLVNKGFQMCFRHGAHACVPHGVMMDRVAAELGLDPTVVALKNDGCRGHDWNWVTQYQRDNGFPQRWSLKEVIYAGKEAMDWDSKRHTPGTRKLANGKMHGLGFISVNEWDWNVFSSLASLVLRDGVVSIHGLLPNCGIDTETGFRRCVASELGMKYEDVIILEQQSEASTYQFMPPGGSWGTTLVVPQLVMAAREMKRKILEYAVKPRPPIDIWYLAVTPYVPAAFEGMATSDLDIENSEIFEVANPSNRKTVKEVADIFWDIDPAISHPAVGAASLQLISDGKPDPTCYVMGRQAHFIEVEVDMETGQIDVTQIVCVNDMGHIFNRRGAEAQQYGGAVMGLGRSIMEEKVFCPTSGVALNNNHIGYQIGTMNDYPPVRCILNESHLGYSAYGAYGIGENVGAAMSGLSSAAIYNATGKWVLHYPTSPDRVLKALGVV